MSLVLDLREILVQGDLLVERAKELKLRTGQGARRGLWRIFPPNL
jgi:hypothetical protein